MLSVHDLPLETSDQFEAQLVWLHEQPGLTCRSVEIKLLHQWGKATQTRLKYRVNINALAQEPIQALNVNDVAVAQLALDRPLVMAPYAKNHELGGFILVDRFSQAALAAGMIRHSLRRAQNVFDQLEQCAA